MKIHYICSGLVAIALSACSMSKGVMSDGSSYTFVSVLENTQDEERMVSPNSFHERKIGKDQVSGAKVVGKTILGAIVANNIGDVLMSKINADAATDAARISASTQEAQIASDTVLGTQKLANEAAAAELMSQ